MAYLLDANIFIQAKNLHYGFDFCPAFWDWLIEKNRASQVLSIEQVADELAAIEDDLSEWAAARGREFFHRPDPPTVPALTQVSAWAAGGCYEPSAVNVFLMKADAYLVAYALAHDHALVTHEIPSTSKKRIKIPDACVALGVKHMTPYAMLSRERARFILAPAP